MQTLSDSRLSNWANINICYSHVSKISITMLPLKLPSHALFHINLVLSSKWCWQNQEILLIFRIASEEMNHFGGMKNIFISYPRKETELGCLGNREGNESHIFCNVYKAQFYYFWTTNPFLLYSYSFMEPIWEYFRETFAIEISD